MAEKKDRRHRIYMNFANLHNRSDGEARAFIEKHGPLGIDPRNSDPSWDYSGKLQKDRQWFFIPWENAWPVPEEKARLEEETPDVIRREARKMYLIIELWEIVGEHINGGIPTEEFFKRKKDVDSLVDELSGLMDDMPGMGYIYWFKPYDQPAQGSGPDIEKGSHEKQWIADMTQALLEVTSGQAGPERDAQIKFPDINYLFDNILKRVRLRVSRDEEAAYRSSLEKGDIPGNIKKENPFGFNLKGGYLEIDEGCLLAKLWYEMISDLMTEKYAKRVCRYCNEIFIPSRPNQHYHVYCQGPAKQHRARKKQAEEDGRALQPKPGRPPKSKGDQEGETITKSSPI